MHPAVPGEEAVSRRQPCLVVHIGQHKTGSKALQSFLAHNQIALRARGLLYPVGDYPCAGIRAYAISQYRLFALIRHEAIGECFGEDAAALYWRQQGRYCTPFDTAHSLFEAFDAELRRSGLGQVIVSAEDLFDMHTAHELAFMPGLIEVGARRLAALASSFGYDTRVAVYLRRQDHLLGAHYVQFIKGSPTHDVDFEVFARAFAPRLDTRQILARWADVFGPDRVLVRRYEPTALPGGIVPDFFEHVLGRSVPAACVQPAADVESVNPTLDRDFVEFIRVLNRRCSAGQPVFPRDAVLEGGRPASRPGSRRQPGATCSTLARRATPPSHAISSAAPTAGYSPNLGPRMPTAGSRIWGSRPNGPPRSRWRSMRPFSPVVCSSQVDPISLVRHNPARSWFDTGAHNASSQAEGAK
jgi:hypothetical protein